ncbi:glycosyltransferase [bacterium]|nr:glycosyltransferase [bacterium]
MKILYVGQLWEGSTCRERLKALVSMDHEVVPFDTSNWERCQNRLLRSIAHRLNIGPVVGSLNAQLKANAHEIGKIDVIWIDKGKWIEKETLQELQRKTRGILVHYTLDAHFYANRSPQFQSALPEYDLAVTTKTFEIDLYKQCKAKNVLLVLQGYDPRFEGYEKPTKTDLRLNSDVAFVGHYQPHYANRLRAVSNVDCQLSVWGPRWPRYALTHQWARGYVKGDGLWGQDYLDALGHTKIALGLLGKHIPETTTTRTFEIPASGTFLLAERNEVHLALFKEGVEAEFFDSDDELRDKLHYYLSKDSLRQRIAKAGRSRAIKSGYSSLCQLHKVIDEIELLRG